MRTMARASDTAPLVSIVMECSHHNDRVLLHARSIVEAIAMRYLLSPRLHSAPHETSVINLSADNT